MINIDELKKESKNAHILMKENYNYSAEKSWLEKEVKSELVLYKGDTLKSLKYNDDLECKITDEEYLINKTSFKMKGNTFAEGISPRPTKVVSIRLDNLDLSNYNRLSFWVKINATGYNGFYSHFSFVNEGHWENHAPIIAPNKWNRVIWEISGFERKNVTELKFTVFMMGTPPEGLPNVDIYLNHISVESVDIDYDWGWDLNERIAFSHVGYFQNSQKQAITQIEADTFEVYTETNELVYQNKIFKEISNLGSFNILDFTPLNNNGFYYLKIKDVTSPLFAINSNPYEISIWKSINFLRALRCGVEIEGIHSPCHLNCRTVHHNGASVPNFGGWHDAGDVSQFEICTGEMAHAILELAETIKNKDIDLYERLLEEAKIGINWLLQTTFKDGYRALAIGYNVWRDNLLSVNNDSVLKNISDNGPFENFIAASALALAANVFKNDEIYSSWCKRTAISDFNYAYDGYKKGIYTKRWGTNIDSQVCGEGILAAIELYKITNENKYLDISKEFAKIVASCQETEGIGVEKIKGFFYEDPLHKYILSYEHRGHEQSPIHGLTKLIELLPNDKEYFLWENTINLYAEYIKKTIYVSSPYNLLPSSIYHLNKINIERFTISKDPKIIEESLSNLKEQIKEGKKIDDNFYLRIFPISVHRRGFHATLLSKAKAISSIYKITRDSELKQIVINQLEWILGKNPFASSTMYGEGYNFHPLYVAFSPQIVGSLPVGIKTKGTKDLPYWPQATEAVYKEIWGHTTGKYLYVLADIL